MTECKYQRQQCQALLAQLKESQSLLKSQYLNGHKTVSGLNLKAQSNTDLTMSTVKPQTGILKTSSVLRSTSRDKFLDFNLNNINNSASPEKYETHSRSKSRSKVLPQGVSSITAESFSDPSYSTSQGGDYFDVSLTDTKEKCNLLEGSYKSSQMLNMQESLSKLTDAGGLGDPLASQKYPMSQSPQTWRQILNKHVTVPSQLSAQELRDLNNLQELNFSYSHPDDLTVETTAGSRTKPLHKRYKQNAGKTLSVCRDITNKPISVSINDMSSARSRQHTEKDENKYQQSKQSEDDAELKRQKVKFFHDQLEDDGNNRKLNSFIKDTTIKPKSLLNSTAYRSLCSSKQNSSGSNLETTAEDQRLLGYDWIAALLDNDSGLVNQSESFFNELKDFRRAYKSECSNQFYREGPHNLVEFEPEPVAEALTETKVHPYIVNERLFTQPFKSSLIDYGDTEEGKEASKETDKKCSPTEENPRFVRVSIPRSTLSTPYKVKPHRRRSFDGSDSCSLMDIAGKPLDLNIIQVYAPTTCSSEEDIEKFYEDLMLDTAKKQCKPQNPLIIMSDFNAKVGQEKVEDIVGNHGLGIKNEIGEKLIEWCQTNNIIIGNTWFQQPPRRKWTWKSPGGETKNQIDYIMISKRFRNALLAAKAYTSANCYSDHVPVAAKFKLKLKKTRNLPTNIKLDLAILKTNQSLREKYQISVQNKFEAFKEVEKIEEQWENFKSALTEAATQV
ncbi:migration and invasion-inhibitory protein [Elysia marginata]|uniref:Migration and invasion-inhibitory protein n=1 Tax=Elysia marginata TaxID=1093978 RepID=A0AAV4ED53_9GAST|nr:migration and invasion-inhibitory protein [Elysia marginata]